MSSAVYLTNLAALYPELIVDLDVLTKDDIWGYLDQAWEDLSAIPSDTELEHLASTAFILAAKLSGKTTVQVIADAMMLHAAKNAGYAGDNKDPWINFRSSTKFGVSHVQGVLVRMSDKYARTQSLRSNPDNDQVGESLLDTVSDLAAYALIAKSIRAEGPVE
jgi:hypothetical protein